MLFAPPIMLFAHKLLSSSGQRVAKTCHMEDGSMPCDRPVNVLLYLLFYYCAKLHLLLLCHWRIKFLLLLSSSWQWQLYNQYVTSLCTKHFIGRDCACDMVTVSACVWPWKTSTFWHQYLYCMKLFALVSTDILLFVIKLNIWNKICNFIIK